MGRGSRCLPPLLLAALAIFGLMPTSPPAFAQPVPNDTGPARSISVTANPRWGVRNPGSWTPYRIRVRNDGSVDFTGRLFLSPEKPTDQRDGSPDWPSYQFAITLPAGAEKTLDRLVQEAPTGYRAELRDRQGRLVSSAAGPEAATRGYPVALLSRVPGAETILEGAPGYFARQVVVTQFDSPRDFPVDVQSLTGLRAVVIDDFDSGALSPNQRQALRDFVELGGRLILGGGAAWERTLSGLPDELVPIRPVGTKVVSLNPLADLGSFTTAVTAVVATGEIRSGRPLVLADGAPLVAEAGLGSGRIVQLTYDPLVEPFSSDSRLAGLAWEQGLARALSSRRAGAKGHDGGAAWASVLDRSAWPRWRALGLMVVAVSALAACLLALWPPTRNRRGWFLLLLATGGLGSLSAGLTNGPANVVTGVVEIRRSTSGGLTSVTTYRGLVATGSFRFEVPEGPGAALATVLTESASPEPGSRSPAMESGGVLADEDGRAELRASGATLESVRPLKTLRYEAGGGLISHLDAVASGSGSAGQISGTVTNRTNLPLGAVWARAMDGRWTRVAASLEPGAIAHIDRAAAATAEGGEQGGRPATLLDAVASEILTSPDQIAVVALTQITSESADRGRGPVVVVQVTTLDERQARATRNSERIAHLASTATISSSSEWIDVYELSGDVGDSVANGGAEVEYVPQERRRAVEIYDWPSGTWRPLPPAPPGYGFVKAPLEPGEVSEGVVRIRCQEASPTELAYWLLLRLGT